MNHYKCKTCGKRHSLYYGIEVEEPITLINIPEEERDSRVASVTTDFFIDKKYMVVKGRLTVATLDWTDNDFNWSIWIRIPASNFREAMPILKSGKTAKIEGFIDSEIPFYQQIKDLKANCYINPNVDDTTIEVTQESMIYSDQQNPISMERAEVLMNRIHHSGDLKKKMEFENSFEFRLDKILYEANSKLGTTESNFTVNIDGHSNNLFQIINAKMLDLGNEQLTIYIPFDTSDIEEKDKLAEFKSTVLYTHFSEIQLDGIPTCYMTFKNIEELKQTVNNLIADFYKADKETIRIDIFET